MRINWKGVGLEMLLMGGAGILTVAEKEVILANPEWVGVVLAVIVILRSLLKKYAGSAVKPA